MGSTGVTKLVVQAGAGRATINLQEWQANNGTPLASISASGILWAQGTTGMQTPAPIGVTGVSSYASNATGIGTATLFSGATGTTGYTIGDIVAALKVAGVIPF